MSETAARTMDVKLRPAFSAEDWAFKIEHIRALLSQGCHVRLIMVLRGPETQHPEQGQEALARAISATADLATVEGEPVTEGRRQSVCLVPHALPGSGSACGGGSRAGSSSQG